MDNCTFYVDKYDSFQAHSNTGRSQAGESGGMGVGVKKIFELKDRKFLSIRGPMVS